ncbi:streptophobe family protein [Streptomyces bullii]|uniref:Streptophobe family protein n=1 Tax=Streptomyces bullii TaxID=349910 RepID=A0ABW0UTU0_9ACTN
MSASTSVQSAAGRARVPFGDVLLCAVAAVSWALIGMAGTAALGLHLLEADGAGSLGPMTAAVVALGAGGSVTPSGDVSAFGLSGAEANTAIEITPLGVSLVGALLLSFIFLRSLRTAGVVIAPAELLARAGAVVALFVAMLGGLAWAGHDVITLDGSSLGLDDLPGGGADAGIEVPGLGDIGGLLPDRIGDLVDARAAVGFTVDTAPTLLGGLGWSAGILLIALLASRSTPLPRGGDALHRVVRPAASAVVTVLLVAVAAGLAAAAYAAIGDEHPKRIAGAALLGAPNGVWLGIPIGLFVPWDGRATGELARLLPDPLDELLRVDSDRPVTLARLAELDSRVWLLGVAAAAMMLLAGVLVAVRTPVELRTGGGGGTARVGGSPARRGAGRAADSGAVREPGAPGFAGRCALRLGVATGLALPLLAWLTEVSVDASLSVLGFDAFGAGIGLRGHLGTALLLGAAWGAGAGAVGALLAWASGAAGRQAAPLARGDAGVEVGLGSGLGSGWAVVGAGSAGAGARGWSGGAVPGGRPERGDGARHAGGGESPARPDEGALAGPYAPGTPYRPPDPVTNPYVRGPGDSRPDGAGRRGRGAVPPPGEPYCSGEPGRPGEAGGSGEPPRPPRSPGAPSAAGDDGGDARDGDAHDGGVHDGGVYGAPTVVRPVGPPPRWPHQPPAPRAGRRPPTRPDDGPPPPPPPPPAPRPPRKPGPGR